MSICALEHFSSSSTCTLHRVGYEFWKNCLKIVSSNIINSVSKFLSRQANHDPVRIFQNNGYFWRYLTRIYYDGERLAVLD